MFRTSNPAFNNESFRAAQSWGDLREQGREPSWAADAGAAPARTNVMTVQGTVNKTGFLLTLCVATSLLAWNLSLDGTAFNASTAWMCMLGGGLGGLVLALICSFVPRSAPVTAPLYALAEGFFVGGISAVYAVNFAGVGDDGEVALNTGLIINAALLTFGILGGLLAAYSTGLIRPGRLFYNIVITGTVGVVLYALVAIVASFFGFPGLASVYDPNNGGLISVGFSVLLVGLASANLVLDFDFINNGAKNQAPKYMEWFGGFGLLVTLVWLYVESLRLLAKLRSE